MQEGLARTRPCIHANAKPGVRMVRTLTRAMPSSLQPSMRMVAWKVHRSSGEYVYAVQLFVQP